MRLPDPAPVPPFSTPSDSSVRPTARGVAPSRSKARSESGSVPESEFTPGVEQREIESRPRRPGRLPRPERVHVALELSAVALELVVEEGLTIAAFVHARLPVDDPAHAFAVDEAPVDPEALHGAADARGEGQLARCLARRGIE